MFDINIGLLADIFILLWKCFHLKKKIVASYSSHRKLKRIVMIMNVEILIYIWRSDGLQLTMC